MIIGISGNSCSGKSTICRELVRKYGEDITYIEADKFFKIENNNYVNGRAIWNTPQDIRFDKLIETILNLKNNKKGYIPSKAFTEKYDKEINPNKIILVEGFLLFTNEKLISLFDKRIFLDVDDRELRNRRLKRNFNEDVDFIKKGVIEPAKRYELLQKENADVIINSNKNLGELLLEIERIVFNV